MRRLPAGTATVEVGLRYQPIAFRWVQNLGAYDAPEPRRFEGLQHGRRACDRYGVE